MAPASSQCCRPPSFMGGVCMRESRGSPARGQMEVKSQEVEQGLSSLGIRPCHLSLFSRMALARLTAESLEDDTLRNQAVPHPAIPQAAHRQKELCLSQACCSNQLPPVSGSPKWALILADPTIQQGRPSMYRTWPGWRGSLAMVRSYRVSESPGYRTDSDPRSQSRTCQ